MPERISIMKSLGHRVALHQYINMTEVGLAAALIYKECAYIGRACVEGEHFFIFEDSDSLGSVLATYGYEDEQLVKGSDYCKIVERLLLEVEDESL
jgi:hypothetical protein